MKIMIFAIFTLSICAGFVSAQDPQSILDRIDANEIYSSIRYEGEMVIEHSGKRYVKTFTASAKGSANNYIEFTNPEDRGTKYLKKDGRLYVYSPDTEEVMLISGHLLKESMMGSDLSYEDTIENEKLSARYSATLRERTEIDGSPAIVLELNAKRKTESYPKEVMWVDAKTYSVLKIELYALSGAKLKEYKLIEARKIGSRYFPVEFEMRDLLRKGSRTSFRMSKVEMDVDVPDSTFSMRNLEK